MVAAIFLPVRSSLISWVTWVSRVGVSIRWNWLQVWWLLSIACLVPAVAAVSRLVVMWIRLSCWSEWCLRDRRSWSCLCCFPERVTLRLLKSRRSVVPFFYVVVIIRSVQVVPKCVCLSKVLLFVSLGFGYILMLVFNLIDRQFMWLACFWLKFIRKKWMC